MLNAPSDSIASSGQTRLTGCSHTHAHWARREESRSTDIDVGARKESHGAVLFRVAREGFLAGDKGLKHHGVQNGRSAHRVEIAIDEDEVRIVAGCALARVLLG